MTATRGLVLVVEHDPETAALVEHALDDAGYEVVVASSGPRVIEELSRHRPDVIFAEWSMPLLSCRELLRHLHADEALSDVPVCVLSSKPIIPPDGGSYLSKPIDPARVVAVANHYRGPV